MLFAIDIGNTNIHAGLFDGSSREPIAHFCLGSDERRSADEYALVLSLLLQRNACDADGIDGVIIGSVVPTLTDTVMTAVRSFTGAPVTVIGPGVKTGFPIRLSDPAELGADIAANTAGAIDAVGYPAIVIAFGTATVVSVVDESGAFQGASILPGVRMSFDALGETGLLKPVSGGTKTPIVGKSTEEAIRSGVLRGQLLAVTGLAEQYKKTLALPDSTPVIVSGGSAEALLPLLPKTYRHIPLLSLCGLCAIDRLNKRKRQE